MSLLPNPRHVLLFTCTICSFAWLFTENVHKPKVQVERQHFNVMCPLTSAYQVLMQLCGTCVKWHLYLVRKCTTQAHCALIQCWKRWSWFSWAGWESNTKLQPNAGGFWQLSLFTKGAFCQFQSEFFSFLKFVSWASQRPVYAGFSQQLLTKLWTHSLTTKY